MSEITGRVGPSRKWLYGPIIGFALLVGLYCVYWFYAIGKIEQELDKWIVEQRAQGVQIEYAAREFGGFPYRFSVRFDAPSYRNWRGNWRGERLELFMQPWNYRHAIAKAPGRNEITSSSLNGTAVLDEKSATSFRWNEIGLTHIGVTLNQAELISGDADASVRGLKANYTVRGEAARIGIDWDEVSVSEDLIAGQDWAFLGPELQASRMRVELVGLQGTEAQLSDAERAVNLAQLRLDWGALKLGAKGDFDITPAGYLDGLFHIRLDEPDRLQTAMAQGGLDDLPSTLVVQAIGAASEDGQFLSLRIKDGALTMPGLTLARLPPIAPPLPEAGFSATGR